MPTRSPERPIHESAPSAASEPGQAVVESKVPDTPAPPHVTAGPPREGRIESWAISGLKQHHWQAALFHDLDGDEFDALVDSMRREGLREPLQVTPDGTIIDGHQRHRAAVQLGWTEIRVRIRDDLAGDQEAIDRAHIEANLSRRQLDPLDKARLARRLMELERGCRSASFSTQEKEELRDRVGRSIGYSGRHAGRLVNILSTPMAVQRAFSKGRLPLVQADKVSRLGWTKQKEIASEIEDGGDPAKVVASYLSKPRPKVKPDKMYKTVMTELARGLEIMEAHVSQLRAVFSDEEDLELLERLGRFKENLALSFTRQAEHLDRLVKEMTGQSRCGGPADEADPAVS
jgi:ParB/RepB/Spo0J family partition protein